MELWNFLVQVEVKVWLTLRVICSLHTIFPFVGCIPWYHLCHICCELNLFECAIFFVVVGICSSKAKCNRLWKQPLKYL